MNPYYPLPIATAPYYREARVTAVGRQTACRMRHCWRSPHCGVPDRQELLRTSTRWAERQRVVGAEANRLAVLTRQRRAMGSAIGKHRTSSSCSLAMRIPFSWGSKGDILFPWKENIPLNRVPARCRDHCAAPTALPPPRHKCREALRTGAKPIVPFIYKR